MCVQALTADNSLCGFYRYIEGCLACHVLPGIDGCVQGNSKKRVYPVRLESKTGTVHCFIGPLTTARPVITAELGLPGYYTYMLPRIPVVISNTGGSGLLIAVFCVRVIH